MRKKYKENDFLYISSKPAYWFNDEQPAQIGQLKNGRYVGLGIMRLIKSGWVGKYKPRNVKKPEDKIKIKELYGD